jgi:AraC-like DNA-binding protein
LVDHPDFRKQPFELPETSDRSTLEWIREEFGRQHFKVDIEPEVDVPLRISGISRSLSDFSVYHGTCSALRSRSTIDPSTPGDFVVTVGLAGDISLRTDDDGIVLKPGTATTGSSNAGGFLQAGTDAEFLTISVRRHLIEQFVPNFTELTQAPMVCNSQAMRLLVGYVRMLDAEETIDDPETRHLVTTHVQDLAALTLGGISDGRALAEQRGVRAGRLAAVKADIAANLASPGLSVASVATRQDLSPRYIHMLFEAEGVTFSEYVVARRLAHAKKLLVDPRFAGRMIGAIALEVGFGDLSYFNRTFRRHFGMTPSEMREAALRANGILGPRPSK